jgi:hypothetical protein
MGKHIDLHRSAVIRAAISSYINNTKPDTLLTIKDVNAALEDNWKSLGYTASPIEGSMHILAGSNIIKKVGRFISGPSAGSMAFTGSHAKLNQEALSLIQPIGAPRKSPTKKVHQSEDKRPTGAAIRNAGDKMQSHELIPSTSLKKVFGPGNSSTAADLSVDLIKETGRVRLTIGGMVIDIGVK